MNVASELKKLTPLNFKGNNHSSCYSFRDENALVKINRMPVDIGLS
jgi:hypothetical protein